MSFFSFFPMMNFGGRAFGSDEVFIFGNVTFHENS